MTKSKSKQKCFIIMPISTPDKGIKEYGGDENHFDHVLNCLFIPALEKAGFSVTPPKSKGSDIIQAEIIKNLSEADLVLCDMSILNPNVFFEFGIRTALNKPVALVVDEKTKPIPFDTHIINYHLYDGSLKVWDIENQITALKDHVSKVDDQSKGRNLLWKYFGITDMGEFKPEGSSLKDKVDLLIRMASPPKYATELPVTAEVLRTIDSPTATVSENIRKFIDAKLLDLNQEEQRKALIEFAQKTEKWKEEKGGRS